MNTDTIDDYRCESIIWFNPLVEEYVHNHQVKAFLYIRILN